MSVSQLLLQLPRKAAKGLWDCACCTDTPVRHALTPSGVAVPPYISGGPYLQVFSMLTMHAHNAGLAAGDMAARRGRYAPAFRSCRPHTRERQTVCYPATKIDWHVKRYLVKRALI